MHQESQKLYIYIKLQAFGAIKTIKTLVSENLESKKFSQALA
jgi:hypothetical protein